MQEATSLRFAEAARDLGQAARLRGLEVPTFRSPPGLDGVQRSIRRRRGSPVVSVQLKNRQWVEVLSDMIEGILIANDMPPAKAQVMRNALWLAVDTGLSQAA
jgi:hypothetical protein